ncbi:MAG TPA: hypothetical protein VE953_23330 [Terriglobales bacterium]|nr:hypothetical protein [Terriglobales bacterium]
MKAERVQIGTVRHRRLRRHHRRLRRAVLTLMVDTGWALVLLLLAVVVLVWLLQLRGS